MKTLYFNKTNHFYIFAFVLLLVSFTTLQPSLQSFVLSSKSEESFSRLLEKSKSDNRIPPKLYWQTREFASPGNITFDKGKISTKNIQDAPFPKNLLQMIDTQYVFLHYSSQKWTSFEMFTSNSNLEDFSTPLMELCDVIILQTNTDLICRLGESQFIIAFVKPIEEMKTANGFFDYNKHDKELLTNNYWLAISHIQK